MKKHLIFLLVFLSFIGAKSQVINPVKWTTKVEQKANKNYVLVFEAIIESGWHLYSQYTPEGGSLPLEISYPNKIGAFELVGKATESKTKTAFNDVFEVNETFFENKARISQEIKILNPEVKQIKANLDFQVCKDVCINLSHKANFVLPKIAVPAEIEVVDTQTNSINTTVKSSKIVEKINESNSSIAKPTTETKNSKSTWSLFLWSFLGGLLATFTPCVFPMIPMTVSFFLKQSSNKSKGKFNALFYGFCIITICVLFTFPFHVLEGISRDIFSNISTNVYLNLFFFAIFSVFAISFFGAFEITMPSKLANKVDDASNSGGLIGVFFMALTLIIVSFSCIGPALGFVFGTSLNSDGGAKILSLAMFGFGLGLSLPFMFFALVPSLLGNLPKSGGWLNTVKVVFGFVELALAFKFLSNADIGLDLHLLEREVFISVWIALFATLSFYLFGKFTLPHDSPLPHISVGRLLLGLLTLTFTFYLIPGLWGAPLKLISAFPPPPNYSESPQGFGVSTSNNNATELPKGAVLGPHDIVSFEEYQLGLAYAKKVNKPILIDFTGKQCVNCRLMENNVWSNPEVLQLLKNKVVLISLYGDDKKELPKNAQYTSAETGDLVTTVGEKWSEFQIQRFKNNSRPFYVLLNLKEEKLIEPISYTSSVPEYLKWLQTGVASF